MLRESSLGRAARKNRLRTLVLKRGQIGFHDARSPDYSLDTGSWDLFVASNACPTDDPEDGCFGLTAPYFIKPNDTILSNDTFYVVVREGEVAGNQSLQHVDFGGVTLPDLAVGLVYRSAKREFQYDSFSGVFGLKMRAVSRQLVFNNRLPPIDALLESHKIKEPKFSLSLPRLGDPDSPEVGKLTLGAIGEEAAGQEITHGPVFSTPNYNDEDWTLDLIIPSDHGNVNGTEYCHAALGRWSRAFGDSIIGVPFLRSVFSVYDSIWVGRVPQPRVGLASLVDGAKAVARYPEVYRGRLR